MIVLQYAVHGSVPSYLDKNINKLTWEMKLQHLMDIANRLVAIYYSQLIHCDLHGGNIVLNDYKPLICDLGLSKTVNLSESSTSTVQGVLPYIAPEVLHSHKFTQKSDIYSFGIIMYQIADGEPPFRNWLSDDNLLAMRICNGLRPEMPDSAPDEYKKLAERCCDADSNNRPVNGEELYYIIDKLIKGIKDNDDAWNTIYYKKNIRPLLRIEKENKYSSRLLPTGNLPKPRNSWAETVEV